MSRQSENTGFICQNCGKKVLPLTDGSYRNHCPFCLYSLHVDITPGDRQCDCGGLMKPIKIVKNKKGFQILHRCQKCGFERYNKINEDMRQPDSIEAITKLMKEQHLP